MKKLLASLLTITIVASCFFAVTANAEDIIDVEGNTYTAVCGEGKWTWTDGPDVPVSSDEPEKTYPTYELTYNNGTVTDEATGEETEDEDSWTFRFKSNGDNLGLIAYTDNCPSTLDEIIVPSYVQVDEATTYAVKEIEEDAAKGSTTIKKVTICDGITAVKDKAFEGCTALEEITIPSTVEVMGRWLMSGDVSLHTVHLNISEKIKTIGESTFYNCSKLTDITIPETITAFGDSAFFGCSALKLDHLPASLTSIEEEALSGTALESVTIPETVTSIKKGVFKGCTSLVSAYIKSKNLTTIPEELFKGCGALSTVEYPGTITSIGKEAFYGTAFTSVTIPETVTELGDGIYYGCTKLTEAYIYSKDLKKIPNDMFHGCKQLSKIEYPETVTELGERAFFEAMAITEFDLTGIEKIGEHCFHGAEQLKAITIPETVTEMGTDVFHWCKKLESACIKSTNITTIPDGTFSECYMLKTVEMPDTVTAFGNSAFYKLGREVGGFDPSLLKGITSVGESCFQWSIPENRIFIIPACLTDIGKCAFQSDDFDYMIFEGKTAPEFGGEPNDPFNNGQGTRKNAGKVYVPEDSTGYEDAFAKYFNNEIMSLHYIGLYLCSITANDTVYTVGYEYNDHDNIYDRTNTEYLNNKLIIALYNADGMLVEAKTVPGNEISANFEPTEEIASAKIFAFDSLTSLKPLYNADELEYKKATAE